MRASRILIIGTGGQLASELRRQPAPTGTILLDPRKVDVSDSSAVQALLDESRPTIVLNASAYTAVDRAEIDRERAFAVNADGPRNLARWCREHGAALVHVSTDYVFDGSQATPYTEQDAPRPLNVYGQSKLAGDEAIVRELEHYLIVRTSWLFSAHGQNFVKTIRRLARERDELRVVSDQRGRPTSAADLARAIWRLVHLHHTERKLAWGTFHLANAGATSWHGFAAAIVDHDAQITGRRPLVVPIPSSQYHTPARRPANSVLDTSRFETTFGFGLPPLTEALADVMLELQARSASSA